MAQATDRLVETTEALQPETVGAPSLLPGWTRGHVLTHVARNADALGNLLSWARTGVETSMYASAAQRDADIAAGADRSPAQLAADVRDSADRLASAVPTVGDDGWRRALRLPSGRKIMAAEVLWFRLREVEVHHVDLQLTYTPAHWSEELVGRLLGEVVAGFTARTDAPALLLLSAQGGRRWTVGDSASPATITGQPRALLGWLIGRTSGDGLVAAPRGVLPRVPPWA